MNETSREPHKKRDVAVKSLKKLRADFVADDSIDDEPVGMQNNCAHGRKLDFDVCAVLFEMHSWYGEFIEVPDRKSGKLNQFLKRNTDAARMYKFGWRMRNFSDPRRADNEEPDLTRTWTNRVRSVAVRMGCQLTMTFESSEGKVDAMMNADTSWNLGRQLYTNKLMADERDLSYAVTKNAMLGYSCSCEQLSATCASPPEGDYKTVFVCDGDEQQECAYRVSIGISNSNSQSEQDTINTKIAYAVNAEIGIEEGVRLQAKIGAKGDTHTGTKRGETVSETMTQNRAALITRYKKPNEILIFQQVLAYCGSVEFAMPNLRILSKHKMLEHTVTFFSEENFSGENFTLSNIRMSDICVPLDRCEERESMWRIASVNVSTFSAGCVCLHENSDCTGISECYQSYAMAKVRSEASRSTIMGISFFVADKRRNHTCTYYPYDSSYRPEPMAWGSCDLDPEDIDTENDGPVDLQKEHVDSENEHPEDLNKEYDNPENLRTEDINPELVDQENLYPEDKDMENVNLLPEDLDNENTDPENLRPEDQNKEDVDPENIETEDLDKENAESENEISEDFYMENSDQENPHQEDNNNEYAHPEDMKTEHVDPENEHPEVLNKEYDDPENVHPEYPDQEDLDAEHQDNKMESETDSPPITTARNTPKSQKTIKKADKKPKAKPAEKKQSK